jgi:hypothetical protein
MCMLINKPRMNPSFQFRQAFRTQNLVSSVNLVILFEWYTSPIPPAPIASKIS